MRTLDTGGQVAEERARQVYKHRTGSCDPPTPTPGDDTKNESSQLPVCRHCPTPQPRYVIMKVRNKKFCNTQKYMQPIRVRGYLEKIHAGDIFFIKVFVFFFLGMVHIERFI